MCRSPPIRSGFRSAKVRGGGRSPSGRRGARAWCHRFGVLAARKSSPARHSSAKVRVIPLGMPTTARTTITRSRAARAVCRVRFSAAGTSTASSQRSSPSVAPRSRAAGSKSSARIACTRRAIRRLACAGVPSRHRGPRALALVCGRGHAARLVSHARRSLRFCRHTKALD